MRMKTGMDYSTRRMILNMLKIRGSLSVGEMAKELGVTEMAVRRHLNTLERDGLISSSLSRQAMGRPTNLYSLTHAADELFPKNYHHLLIDLLDEIEQDGSESEAVGKLFERRKQKLLQKYAPRMEGKGLEARVAELADIQNAGGYMVEWEKDEQGDFVFKEYNCPITQVANKYNQACQCELALFRDLLGSPVERTECLAKGGNQCTYRIQQTQS